MLRMRSKQQVVHSLVLGCILAGFVSYGTAQLRINEFLADNVSVNPDNYDFDDFSDWLELHNTGNTPVDISGYYLTDELSQPQKWQVPNGTSIPAGGYLLIWTDDFDGEPGQKETREWYPWKEKYTLKGYHAVFKLDKEGEEIGLFDASGSLVDSVSFGQQFHDVSMGRKADGSWAFFDEPTPGAANVTTAKPLSTSEICGEVTFSVEGGFYKRAQTVTLNTKGNEDIYYTTDGSVPYPSDKKYSSPVSVSTTINLRARAFTADKLGGKVCTNTYFINEKNRTVMVASIATDPDFLNDNTIGIWKNNMKGREVPAALEFFTTDGKRVAHFNAGIRNGTLTGFSKDQHPLQVALRDRYGDEFVEYRFFDKPITKFNRLRLRQGSDAWSDSFINDAILDAINKGQTDVGYQAFRPVVVYVNGEYYGLMNLREQFKEQFFKENFGIDASNRDEVRSILLPSGGILGYTEGWELIKGTWDSRRSLIQSVRTGTIDDAKYSQLQNTVNIASFSDFFILITFGNAITWGHNQDMWKLPDGKWNWLVTDFDRCWAYKGFGLGGGGVSNNLFTSVVSDDTLFSKMITNTKYRDYFVQRYAAHLNSTLSSGRLTKIVDSIASLIEPEMAEHAQLWASHGGISSLTSWKSEVADIRKFMEERQSYSWDHFSSRPLSLSNGTAVLTVKVSPTEANARILINGVPMTQGLSNIKLFEDIPFELSGKDNGKWKFKGWSEGGAGSALSLTLDGNKQVTAVYEEGAAVYKEANEISIMNGFCEDYISMKNGVSTIHVTFTSSVTDKVNVSLFNLRGQEVAKLFASTLQPGKVNTVNIPVHRAAGVYFYRIQSGSRNKMDKITIK